MYRDGVGEGQFKLVLAHELQAIRNACLELEKDGSYTPGVTFVCVQKRHHMRLFCQERADMVRYFFIKFRLFLNLKINFRYYIFRELKN